MAKKTTVRRVKGRMLVPNREKFKDVIDIGDCKVTGLTISVTASKEVPRLKMDRLEKEAYNVMDNYEKTIKEEVTKLADKVRKLRGPNYKKASEKSLAEANKVIESTNKSVKNAVDSIQSAINVAVEKRMKIEARGDQNLKEYRIKVAAQVVFKVIKIVEPTARLAVTGGLDVLAWKKLVVNLYGVVNIVNDFCKGEEKLRSELLSAIGSYSTDKQRRIIEETKARGSLKGKIKLKAKDIYRKVKDKAKQAEDRRKRYRNELTSMRNKIDSKMSKQIDAAEGLYKKSKSIPVAKKLWDEMHKVKALSNGLVAEIEAKEQFASDMKMLLTEAGVETDDRTFVEKLKQGGGKKELKNFASDLKSAVKNIEKIVEHVS